MGQRYCTLRRKEAAAGWRHSHAETTEHRAGPAASTLSQSTGDIPATPQVLICTPVSHTLTAETKRSSLVILNHKGILWAAQSDRPAQNLVLPVAGAHRCRQERG